jgi:hypothetical protein
MRGEEKENPILCHIPGLLITPQGNRFQEKKQHTTVLIRIETSNELNAFAAGDRDFTVAYTLWDSVKV